MGLKVNVIWALDARARIAESDEAPGPVLESGSFDALAERLRYAVPALMALNKDPDGSVPLYVIPQRHECVAI